MGRATLCHLMIFGLRADLWCTRICSGGILSRLAFWSRALLRWEGICFCSMSPPSRWKSSLISRGRTLHLESRNLWGILGTIAVWNLGFYLVFTQCQVEYLCFWRNWRVPLHMILFIRSRRGLAQHWLVRCCEYVENFCVFCWRVFLVDLPDPKSWIFIGIWTTRLSRSHLLFLWSQHPRFKRCQFRKLLRTLEFIQVWPSPEPYSVQ